MRTNYTSASMSTGRVYLDEVIEGSSYEMVFSPFTNTETIKVCIGQYKTFDEADEAFMNIIENDDFDPLR